MIHESIPITERAPANFGRRQARSQCSFNHPCMRRDDSWRDLPEKLSILIQCKGGLPEFVAKATNGVLVYGFKPLSGEEHVAHYTNCIFPEDPMKFFSACRNAKPKAAKQPKEKKPSRISLALAECDLF